MCHGRTSHTCVTGALLTCCICSKELEKSFPSSAHFAWTMLLVMSAMLLVNHFTFESGSLIYPLLFFCVWVYCRLPAQRNSIMSVFGLFQMQAA
jgi:hypothetical protein